MFNTNEEFYTLLSNVLRLSRTPEVGELGLKSFVVYDTPSDRGDDQLGKDLSEKDKPYMFSKLWDEQGYPANAIAKEYPLLYIYPLNQTIAKPFSESSQTRIASYEMGICDKLYLKPEEQTNILKQRNKHEIYRDCIKLFQQLIQTLKTVKAYYDVSLNLYYLPSNYVASLPDPNIYTLNGPKTLIFNSSLKAFASLELDYWWGDGSNLYGVFVPVITIPLDPCITDIIPMSPINIPLWL